MIKRIFFLPQLMFVSFVSDIIQFAFIVSTSINSFIKVDADTVGLHETQRSAKPFFHDFNGTDPEGSQGVCQQIPSQAWTLKYGIDLRLDSQNE